MTKAIPYARVQEVFKDQFDLKISQGTLCNFNLEAYEKLEVFEGEFIKKLRTEKVLNADGTGIKIDAQLGWTHVLSTPKFTFIYSHEKRAKDVMVDMGIIPGYKGILIHDHWKPYLGYDCEHVLCNAHHLRKLQWVIDCKKKKWVTSIKNFLIKLNIEVDEHGGVLPGAIQKRRIKRYIELVMLGNPECPFKMPAIGSGKKRENKRRKEIF
jgi:transposase